MADFRKNSSFHNVNNGPTKAKKLETVNVSNSSLTVNMVKVFLYMFIGLAITGGIATGLGYWVSSSYYANPNNDTIPTIYLGLLIGSAIALLILMLIINFVILRGKHSILIPGILYTVVMGVLLSSLTIFAGKDEWSMIGMAFGITAGIFLFMTLIALVTKGNMSSMATLGIGLIVGSIILGLVNLLLRSSVLYWIVSFAIFAALMFITMYDIWRIKKISEQGQMSNNVALYCAFVIYVDFINIFLRILYFLILIFGKKN